MSPRNVKRDIEQRELRREHILNAALMTIARQGIDSASIKEIATAAGVSVGNVYTYFESKDAIIRELLTRGQHKYGAVVASLAGQALDARMKLYRICRGWIETDYNWAFTIMLQGMRMHNAISDELKHTATIRFTQNLSPMSDIMQQGQEQGVIKDGDPQQLAFYFVSLIQGLTLQLAPGYAIPVGIEAENIVRLFMSPVSKDEESVLFAAIRSSEYDFKKMFDNA